MRFEVLVEARQPVALPVALRDQVSRECLEPHREAFDRLSSELSSLALLGREGPKPALRRAWRENDWHAVGTCRRASARALQENVAEAGRA